LIPYAEPVGFATRSVDGNDAWDVYHSARWARATALSGRPVFLDCITFRSGTYSSHFGETRPGIEKDLAEWERCDPLKRMAEWLIESGAASLAELERLGEEEEKRILEAFNQVSAEVKGN
jgi:TPP-dependent pyruvate/acetoin dehydrogenase alpha subunit